MHLPRTKKPYYCWLAYYKSKLITDLNDSSWSHCMHSFLLSAINTCMYVFIRQRTIQQRHYKNSSRQDSQAIKRSRLPYQSKPLCYNWVRLPKMTALPLPCKHPYSKLETLPFFGFFVAPLVMSIHAARRSLLTYTECLAFFTAQNILINHRRELTSIFFPNDTIRCADIICDGRAILV